MRRYEPITYEKTLDESGDSYTMKLITRPRLGLVDARDAVFVDGALSFLGQEGYYPTGRRDILNLTVEVARGRFWATWCRLGWWAEEAFWKVASATFRMGLWHRKHWSPGERLRWRDVRPGPRLRK